MSEMPIADLQEIIDLPRNGCLLDDSDLAALEGLASKVECIASEEYWAPSAASAAAWLLRLAHQNADLLAIQDTRLPRLSPRPRLLCFRGQAAKYLLLAPSISRVDSKHKNRNQMAIAWLKVALQLWVNERFHLSPHNDVWATTRSYWLDTNEAVLPVAQHYGLGTNLIDWTWDPFIALCFASQKLLTRTDDPRECAGRVCIRSIDPESKGQAMLPPSFARRIWLQRGLFQYQPDPGDIPVITAQLGVLGKVAESRQQVNSYPNISFACSETDRAVAERIILGLTLQDDPLLRLMKWALSVADVLFEPPRRSLAYLPNLEQLKEELPENFLLDFEHIVDSSTDTSEDKRLMVDYVTTASIRRSVAGHQYDAAALYLLAKGMTDRHFLCRKPTGDADTTIEILQRFMSKADFFYAMARDGHFGDPPLWP